MDLGTLVLVLVFGAIGMEVYSYLVGTSYLKGILSGTFGGIGGSVLAIFSDLSSLFTSTINNFFQSGYMGTSLLLVAMVFFAGIVIFNAIITMPDPTPIR